ncbi:MAG: phage tail tube protein [Planctomycetia bacterium]|nr:phage tail tube protein [Planctomycetia bacterium]
MGIRLGFQCAMYYGPAGAPAATLLENVKDAKFNLEKSEADVTTRRSNGWEQTVGVLKKGSVEFDMIWDTDDAAFAYFLNAWLNDQAVAMKILDGVGGHGLDADFSVINIGRDETLTEAVKASVTVKPTYSTRTPAWV